MYTFQRVPASQGLEGIMDMFNAKSYWNVLKGKIAEIQGLGLVITQHLQKLGIAYSALVKRGRQDLADQLSDEVNKANDDLRKWWKVKGYIDKYLPQWMMIDKNTKVGPTGVGVIPVVLAGMALVALAYCVNTGMALLQDYQFKKILTSAVIEQKMTSGQAAEILSVPKSEGILEKVVGTVGVGMSIGIPTALVVGGGLYLLFTTGMLKGILGSVQGLIPSSSGRNT